MVHIASPTLEGNTKMRISFKDGTLRESENQQRRKTDWKMQPMIIIFPSRGSIGSRARIRPRGVSSSLESRASSSATNTEITVKIIHVETDGKKRIFKNKT